MTVVTTLGKGQVVIPKPIRDQLGLSPGRRLSVQVRDEEIVLRLLPKDPIHALCGVLKGRGSLTKDLLEERRKERAREDRKFARFFRSP